VKDGRIARDLRICTMAEYKKTEVPAETDYHLQNKTKQEKII